MKVPGRSMVTTENTGDVGDQDPDATSAEPAIGAAVMVSTVDGETAHGVIVDDFGDLAGTSVEIGTERVARARRWAADVDSGHIVFVDDDEILEVVAPQSQP